MLKFFHMYTVFCLHSGINDLVFLESDNESESGSGRERGKDNKSISGGFGVVKGLDWSSRFVESTSSLGMFFMYLSYLWFGYLSA